LHELLSFSGAFFRAYLRGLAVPCHGAVCGRDGLTRDFGRSRHENLSGAISWLTFFAGGAADARNPKRLGGAKARPREFGGRQFAN
jgi:hypothetical protein